MSIGQPVADRQNGLLPVRLEDEVVPVRDLIVHRAAGWAVAERDAAIHAARRLVAQVALVDRQRELAEMAHAVAGELILLLLPVVFEKPCDLTHPNSFGVLAGLTRRMSFLVRHGRA